MTSFPKAYKFVTEDFAVKQHCCTSETTNKDEPLKHFMALEFVLYQHNGAGIKLVLPYLDSTQLRELAVVISETADLQESVEKKNALPEDPTTHTIPGC